MPRTKKTKAQTELAPVVPEPAKPPEKEPTKPPVIKMKRWLRHDFKQGEIIDLSKDLAQNVERVTTLNSELDSIKSTYRAKIGMAESRIALLSQAVNKGYDMRDIECITEMHKPKDGIKTVSRLDTFEVVETEEMDAVEMQEQLPLQTDEDAADQDAAEKAEAKIE